MDLEAQVNKQEMENKLLEYFKGDELAANVFKSKYAQEGDVTPDDMHKRMAKEFAKVEKQYILKLEDKAHCYNDLSEAQPIKQESI